MPFPITCTACGKTFAIADDVYERKVKGRVVTIKCKQCQAGIRIDDSRGGISAATVELPVAAQPERALAPAATTAPIAATPKEEPKTALEVESKAAEVPPPQAAAATKAQPTPAATTTKAQPAPATTTKVQPAPATAPKAQPAPAATAPKAQSTAVPGESAPKAQSAPVAPRSPTLLGITAPKAHHLAAAAAGNSAEPVAAAARAQPVAASAPRAQPIPAASRAEPGVAMATTPKAPATATPIASASAPKAQYAKPDSKPLAATRPEPEPVLATEILWAVDYPDGQDRELTAEQIKRELGSGGINETTLVWREGMDEWQELSQVPELLAAKLAPAPPAAQRAKAPSAPQLELAVQRARAPSSPALPEPAAHKPRAPSAPFIPAPAAQRPKMPSTSALSPPAPIPRAPTPFTPFDTPFDAPKPPATFPAASLPISDLTPLAFPASPAPAAIPARPAPLATARAAVPFVPQHALPIAAVPQRAALDEWPQPKSRAPLIIGVAIAILAIGAAIYFLTNSREAPPPAAPISALPPTAPTTTHIAEAAPTADTAAALERTATSEGSPPRGALDQPGAAPMTTPNAGFAELFANGARRADEKQGAAGPTQRFDASAAKAALATAAASTPACREKGGPAGKATIVVTFEPSGKVSSATVSDAPFAGTSSGACLAATMKRASIPAFSGLPGTVTKIISIQ